tara:strand:+ start:832 stop:1176 length:345 start_codon:yes stop_codon:yes gene_type:complete
MLAVIHDSTNRRFRTRGDFHQIHLLSGGFLQRFLQGHNTDLLTVYINQPNIGCLDLLIYIGALLAAFASTLNVVNLQSVIENEAGCLTASVNRRALYATTTGTTTPTPVAGVRN